MNPNIDKATYHFLRGIYFYAMGNPIWHIEHASAMKAAGIDTGPKRLPKNARPNPHRRNANKAFFTENYTLQTDGVVPVLSPAMAKFAAMSRQ